MNNPIAMFLQCTSANRLSEVDRPITERAAALGHVYAQHCVDSAIPDQIEKLKRIRANTGAGLWLTQDEFNASQRIYLVKGKDIGRSAWYYVLVHGPRLVEFVQALADPIIHLEEYGQILRSGYGDEPPEHVTKYIKAQYNID